MSRGNHLFGARLVLFSCAATLCGAQLFHAVGAGISPRAGEAREGRVIIIVKSRAFAASIRGTGARLSSTAA
jgi:hypothetical protein